MFRKIMSILLSVTICVTMPATKMFCSAIGTSQANYTIDKYTYPITVDSDGWDSYSVVEKVEMLEIPEATLSAMTDDALLDAVASYPYLIDIYLYGNSVEDGMEVARKYFSALDELLSRESAQECAVAYGNTLARKVYQTRSNDVDNHELFTTQAMIDIAAVIADRNSDSSVYVLPGYPTPVYLYTPNNTRVLAYAYSEEHQASVHNAQDAEIVETYNVTLVSRGSCCYNCHSYVWYSTSTSNRYWINDPSAYMEDGSYTRKHLPSMSTPVNATSIEYGDYIFYGDLEGDANEWHSAIYLGGSATGAPLATQLCVSKWGQLGVFQHIMSNVPAGYDTVHISGWG